MSAVDFLVWATKLAGATDRYRYGALVRPTWEGAIIMGPPSRRAPDLEPDLEPDCEPDVASEIGDQIGA